MNFLRFFQSIIAMCLVVVITTGFVNSKELKSTKASLGLNNQPVQLNCSNNSVTKKDMDKILELDYILLDSLANMFSFFSEATQPYIYEQQTSTLVMVKRGAIDHQINTSYTGDNTKNNLFVRTSKDWGQTWSNPIKIYDEKIHKMGAGRYPTITGFEYEGELILAYTAPIVSESGTGWRGFMNGFYSESTDEINVFSSHPQLDGNILEWGTDAGILGGLINGEPYAIAASQLSSPDDQAYNNFIGYRKSNEQLSSWPTVIPPQWYGTKFTSAQVGYLTRQVVGLGRDASGKMYLGVYGSYIAGEVANRTDPGVSYSTDNGDTWSEFEIFPHSLLMNYSNSVGVDPDSSTFTWDSKDFVVFDNGDFSFALHFREGVQSKLPKDLKREILEVYKEGGAWGIRKIADDSFYMVYIDVTSETTGERQNQLGTELQLSRTVDGSKLLAKWIKQHGVEWVTDSTYTFSTTDVLISTRNKTSNTWSDTVNVTNDTFIDRCSWIPDLLPNDLTNIPLLKLITSPDEDDIEMDSMFIKQFYAEVPQYLLMGYFNTTVGVEDNDNNISEDSYNVYPNPANDYAEVTFNLSKEGTINIELYNELGSKVKDIYNGYLGSGLRSVSFKTMDLPVGAYYCVINNNGKNITKQINIIR
jgi:hypothetical protein